MPSLIGRLWKNYLRVVEGGLLLLLTPFNWLGKNLPKWQKKLKKRWAKLSFNLRDKKTSKPKQSKTKRTSFVQELLKNYQKFTADTKYLLIWKFKDFQQNIKDARRRTSKRLKNLRFPKFHLVISLPKLNLPHFPTKKERSQKKKRQPLTNRAYKIISIVSLTVALAVTGANSVYAFYYYVLHDLPSPEKLNSDQVPQTTKIYDRNGVLLYQIYGRQNRSWVSLQDIPKNVIDATISMEDKDFYRNPGFSVSGIARAALAQVQGQPLQGGSTITQQLVKNVFLSPERTWTRKLKEFILALETEHRYSKDQILEMYLNIVGYGGQAYGIEAASEQYFGIPAKELSLAQASLLAGLPASPTTFSPYGAHPEMAKARQEAVLRRMFEDNKITFDQMQSAQTETISYKPQVTSIVAPHFVMWIRELLVAQYGEEMVASGGLTVRTSLDVSLQKMAEEEIDRQLATLQFENVTNGAAMITDTKTGEVLAMVGSRDYWDTAHDGNVNVALALRQPGSSIKVVNYATALEDGFKANTIIQDSPVSYSYVGGPTYTPLNYDGRFHGPVTVRTALASSYNVPAVKVLSTIGVPKMVNKGIALGLTNWKTVDPGRFGLALTLGGVEVTMTEMMEVYSTLGNMGTKVDLNPFLEIKDSNGNIIQSIPSDPSDPANPPVVRPAVAYILTKILSDNAARTPAFGPASVLNIPGYPDVAVKTGTTNNLRDNWTFGYTPTYTVGTWVGNNDNSPMSAVASGITGASPIWSNIMKNLVSGKPNQPFTMPAGVVVANVCQYTGTLACGACPGYSEYFVAGTQPAVACNDEQIKAYQEAQQKKADEAAAAAAAQGH